MTLRPDPENSAADWISGSKLPWQQLVGFGPAGFPAYARLRILPDPTHPDQSENEAAACPGVLPELEMMQAAVVSLRLHTTTAEDLYKGAVSESRRWSIAAEVPAPGQQWIPTPAFVWPADRAWCVSKDVDPHWMGVGASTEAVSELLADPRLNAINADPAQWPPSYC